MAIQFQNPKEYIAELIGTMIFIAIGCTVAAYAWRGGSSLMVAFGFAAAFIGLIYCIGKVSDCHFNPLITLSMFINGRMNAADTLFYVLAQIIGGILGAIFSFFLVSQSPALFPNNNVIVYPSVYGGSFPYMVGIEVIGAFLLEMFFAFILCYIALKATESRKIEMKSGAIIAAAMFALIYFGCMVTYTAVNPAKSIGAAFAMLFSGAQDKSEPLIQLWLFIIAPAIGALIASFSYMILESGSFDVDKFVEDMKKKKEEKAAQKAAEAEAKAEAEAAAAEAEATEEAAEEAPAEEEVSEEIPEIESIEEEPAAPEEKQE